MKITSTELRSKFINFFEKNEHTNIYSSSLIPENDPTVLFTTAGMQPLVPYLMGEKHPSGKRLTNCQKCVRTGDLEEVGDSSHCTFFEMLGNWSLGDYFKEEAISFSYSFLVNELHINPENLAVSVFEGDDFAPRDNAAASIWQNLGINKNDIYFLNRKHNFWGPAGTTGPCGTDSEMFIKVKEKCCENCSPACDCGAFLEIWNDVFMEFDKKADGSLGYLKQKNVDTGMGLERTLVVLNGYKTVYDTDLFDNARKELEKTTGLEYKNNDENTKAFRVILDHVRTSVMLLGDEKGVVPSNVDQGYVLRRLIRRAVRFGKKLGLNSLLNIADAFIETYKDIYTSLKDKKEFILAELKKEEDKFSKTLEGGLKEFEKLVAKQNGEIIDGQSAFRLFDTFGFPVEITEELAKERNLAVDTLGFKAAFKAHQEKSRAGSEAKFACGLADNLEETTNLHTATHLLLATLKKMFGNDVNQRGSNITSERLRFDFNFSRALTKEELVEIENRVNDVIKSNAAVVMKEMSLIEAKEQGFTGIFTDKYDSLVKTFDIGGYSKEICGGPHAKNTGDLGTFKIQKEQSASSGVRRIKAVLIK